ncbi:magnetosome protein Mad17 [Candidatus Magnetominusculus xianensis]|uniref:Magnetosome protein Mad17 n=2 Tax=Candidatus Magnetominusculus xianensis TaxID=1748249 RepID=A0ABR5SPC0_9BACT|nr:magnetosome protein Mad17 [Candidatus Magnetominusculus xianensis]
MKETLGSAEKSHSHQMPLAPVAAELPTPRKVSQKVIVTGLPNSGKSQIFNNLTGEYSIVANYPLSTVCVKQGQFRMGDEQYEVYDTPGLYCLFIHSEDELVVRDLIFQEKPDVLLLCIDANLLKQSLALAADLIELQIPMVIAINAIDETARKGLWIDSATLSQITGVPVVESIAIKGIGTNKLKSAIQKARVGSLSIHYGDIMTRGISTVESLLPEALPYKHKTSMLALLNDPFLDNYLIDNVPEEQLQKIQDTVDEIQDYFKGNLARTINHKRAEWVDSVTEKIIRRQVAFAGRVSETIARMCRSVVFGVPILMGIIVITYFLVVNVADWLSKRLDAILWAPVQEYLNALIPYPFWNEFFIGQYGVLTLGVAGAILTVLPILSVYFILYNILEDVGYIPNLSVLSRRVFDKIGLSGASIMPMVLGFGCKTMATLTAKTLTSPKERYITTFLIAFALPCAPQIGLNMSLLGKVGITAFIITFSVLATIEAVTGLILNKIIKEDDKNCFIQALPAIRMPNLKAVIKKTYYRLFWFLEEALPAFMYAAIAMFTLDKTGLLKASKVFLQPVVERFMGLPTEMVDALILVIARREAAASVIIKMSENGHLNYVQSIVAVVLTTMFVPCMAHIGIIVKQQGWKSTVFMVFTMTITSVIIAGILNKLLLLFF